MNSLEWWRYGGTVRYHRARGAARSPFASWWRSRYGLRLLLEAGLVVGLLLTYMRVRQFTRGDLRAAFQNTREVMQFERWIGLPFEDNLQRALLTPSRAGEVLEPLLPVVPFPGRDRPADLVVLAPQRPLLLHPAPDGGRDVRRPRHPRRVPAGAAAHDARLRRHDVPLRPVDLHPQHARRGGQPDRRDAVAALRVGGDRGDGGGSCEPFPLALRRGAPPDPDGDGHRRHRQPLVGRRRRRRSHHLLLLGRGEGRGPRARPPASESWEDDGAYTTGGAQTSSTNVRC